MQYCCCSNLLGIVCEITVIVVFKVCQRMRRVTWRRSLSHTRDFHHDVRRLSVGFRFGALVGNAVAARAFRNVRGFP